MLLEKNLSEKEFYDALWLLVYDSTLFPERDSQVLAFCQIWQDPRIPYFYLSDGLDMEDERFYELSSAISQDIAKARFALYTNKFKSKTTRASVLLELIEKYVDSPEKKIVLLAQIITFAGTKNIGYQEIKAIVESLLDEIKEP